MASRSNFPKAKLAIEYRQEIADCIELLNDYLPEFNKLLLATLETNPQISAHDLQRQIILAFESEYGVEENSEEHTAYLNISKLGSSAKQEFKTALKTLGSTTDLKLLVRELTAKHSPVEERTSVVRDDGERKTDAHEARMPDHFSVSREDSAITIPDVQKELNESRFDVSERDYQPIPKSSTEDSPAIHRETRRWLSPTAVLKILDLVPSFLAIPYILGSLLYFMFVPDTLYYALGIYFDMWFPVLTEFWGYLIVLVLVGLPIISFLLYALLLFQSFHVLFKFVFDTYDPSFHGYVTMYPASLIILSLVAILIGKLVSRN